jgi:hypothetical protein
VVHGIHRGRENLREIAVTNRAGKRLDMVRMSGQRLLWRLILTLFVQPPESYLHGFFGCRIAFSWNQALSS